VQAVLSLLVLRAFLHLAPQDLAVLAVEARGRGKVAAARQAYLLEMVGIQELGVLAGLAALP